jgi:hypothetical protein
MGVRRRGKREIVTSDTVSNFPVQWLGLLVNDHASQSLGYMQLRRHFVYNVQRPRAGKLSNVKQLLISLVYSALASEPGSPVFDYLS